MAWPQGNRVSLDLLPGSGLEPSVSLVPREDSARKLAGLFGTEARPDGDTAANKIFHYIPGTVSGGGVSGWSGMARGLESEYNFVLPGMCVLQ